MTDTEKGLAVIGIGTGLATALVLGMRRVAEAATIEAQTASVKDYLVAVLVWRNGIWLSGADAGVIHSGETVAINVSAPCLLSYGANKIELETGWNQFVWK